jgi:hypothetical protein
LSQEQEQVRVEVQQKAERERQEVLRRQREHGQNLKSMVASQTKGRDVKALSPEQEQAREEAQRKKEATSELNSPDAWSLYSPTDGFPSKAADRSPSSDCTDRSPDSRSDRLLRLRRESTRRT